MKTTNPRLARSTSAATVTAGTPSSTSRRGRDECGSALRAVARGARCAVCGELGRSLPYRGMPDCLMNFASPAYRQRARSPNIHAFMPRPRSAPPLLSTRRNSHNGKRVERLERKAMGPVSRGRQASEARDAAAEGILMSGAILIVESDAALAQSLHDGLAGLGYTVELALHGGDGLMLASLSRPDVVILDADLCDRTGLEVMRQLHELDKSIAVVMLGDSGGDAARREALKAGAFDYLRKPVEAADLAHAGAAAGPGARPGVVVSVCHERRGWPAAAVRAVGETRGARRRAVARISRGV